MKQLAVWMMTLCLLVLPVAATPYTESELEEYMEAVYCEQVWAEDYPDFWVQFIDVDLDGRKELLSVEAGETDAPKYAHAYAFMDAELSHRGFLIIGKLDVCRDTKTDESFVVNYMEDTVQRLVYDPEAMRIGVRDLTEKEVQRLESYGYDPILVTKADWKTIKVYEDCRALFLPAYQHNEYTNGTPPMMEAVDYEAPSVSKTASWGVAAVVAAAIALATVAFLKVRRIKVPR